MDVGTLVLVVGASGVGKDSLIDAARCALSRDGGFVFPQRIITRHAGAGGELHRAVSEDEFAQIRERGLLSLSWQAHGFWYGIASDMEDELAAGSSVVVNASRTIIPTVRKRYPRRLIVNVTAPMGVISERLRGRGREDEQVIERRIARADQLLVKDDDVFMFANDRPLPDSARYFVQYLLSYCTARQ